MTSTIKVDTISENTSANGVAVDGVTLKDGGITATGNILTASNNTDDTNKEAHFIARQYDSGTETEGFQILQTFANSSENRLDIGGASSAYNASTSIGFHTASNTTTRTGTEAFRILNNGHGVFGVGHLSNFGIPTSAALFSATSNTTNAANDLTTVGSNVATNNIGVINDSNSGILSSIGMETRVTGAGRAAIHNMWQATYQSDLVFRLRTGSGSSGELFRINSGEQCISTGAETSPDVSAGGLTLNIGDLDGNILTCKSSDVAQGVTANAEADTFFQLRKLVSASGGAVLRGFTEGEQAIQIFGAADSANTTKSTSGEGIVAVTAYVKGGNGTQAVDPGTNANLFVVNQGGNAKFIVDTEGQLHSDGGAQSAYDTYEDAQLVRAFDLSHGRGVIDSKFDKFISYNHEKLADMKLVGREEDGTPNHFINVTGMQRLHNGAIWQQYEKHQKLASAFYKLAEKTIGKEEADKLLTDEEIELLN